MKSATNTNLLLQYSREFLWLLIALVLAGMVNAPLVADFEYNELLLNLGMVVVFVTLLRYVVFYRDIPHLKSTAGRFIAFAVVVNLFIWIVYGMQGFMQSIDNFDLGNYSNAPIDHLSSKRQVWLLKYLRAEFIFFGSGCLMLILLFIGRMLLMYYRRVNRGLNDQI